MVDLGSVAMAVATAAVLGGATVDATVDAMAVVLERPMVEVTEARMEVE